MRSFLLTHPATDRQKLLLWASEFPYAISLNNCESTIDRYGRIEWMLGVGRIGLSTWADWQQSKGQWILGALPYEWKSRADERLRSAIPPEIAWPELPGFVPELLLVQLRGSTRVWVLKDALEGWEAALSSPLPLPTRVTSPPVFVPNFSRQDYLERVERLRQHIKDGDCYEINLAQTFSVGYHCEFPTELYHRLTAISPVPFASWFKWEDLHLLCASPERFLQHRKGQLLTQPIKGTARRGEDPRSDQAQIQHLQSSPKEQAENVMIVDLSRHDLNRLCKPHSVQVPHLFEVQTFPQVHQLVSTVVGGLTPGRDPIGALAEIFPPGSMTGAPKHRVMQLIDEVESQGRGLYAGSVGYLSPGGDFDFNVVIRSLVYDHRRQRLNYHVGGAITYDSDPAQEYEETLLKAAAIRGVFGQE